jgi:hypothetical protein
LDIFLPFSGFARAWLCAISAAQDAAAIHNGNLGEKFSADREPLRPVTVTGKAVPDPPSVIGPGIGAACLAAAIGVCELTISLFWPLKTQR